MNDLVRRVRLLRERVYIAAPLDDLSNPLHDVCAELSYIEGEIVGAQYTVAAAEEAAMDARRERRDMEIDLERARKALETVRSFLETFDRADADVGKAIEACVWGCDDRR